MILGPDNRRGALRVDADGRLLTTGGGGGGGGSLTGDQAAAVEGVAGDLILSPVSAPAAATGSAGALTGAYYYTVTFVTALGETEPWPGTATVVNPSAQRVNLSSIPTGPAGVLARRLYRSVANPVDVKDYKFLAEIGDNTTTVYEDNTADGALGAPANWGATNRGILTNGSERVGSFSGQSTSIGELAFSTNVGYASSAFGYAALAACTQGRRNTAVGTYALTTMTVGYENTAVGVHAGQSVLTGAGNTFLGYRSGFNSGGTCNFNTAVGVDSMAGVTALGSNNTALGRRALGDINTADQCVGVGYAAGKYANASRQVFIDNADRANISNCQNIGLIYAKGEGTAAAQVMHLNAHVRIGAGNAPVVAGLPAAAAGFKGYRGYVTDATVAYTSANVGSTVAGGGANTVPVFCNGTNWVIG